MNTIMKNFEIEITIKAESYLHAMEIMSKLETVAKIEFGRIEQTEEED